MSAARALWPSRLPLGQGAATVTVTVTVTVTGTVRVTRLH